MIINLNFSKYDSISLKMLEETNILDRPNCEMREDLYKICSEKNINLYASYRSNRVDWLLALAKKGAGAVILPQTAIPNDDNIISLPIDNTDITRQIVAIRYRHQPSRCETENLLKKLINFSNSN